MTKEGIPQILPALMGSLHQNRARGELVLEQNDGCRKLYWQQGELVFLQSDVAGEQFGSYLLRQGILDFPTLQELHASQESGKLGDRVVSWGLMSVAERDRYLSTFQQQILLHAVEHPLVKADWRPATDFARLVDDLPFPIDHRTFVWNAFRQIQSPIDLVDLLYAESTWRWHAPSDLLHQLSDLPLDPQSAFALSFLGKEPLGYLTFLSITGLEESTGALLLVSLWALGAITLVQGEAPRLQRLMPHATPPPVVEVPPSADAATPPVSSSPLPLRQPPPVEFVTPVEEEEDADEDSPVLPLLEEHASPEAPEDPAQDRLLARQCFVKAKSLLIQERTAEAIRMLERAVQLNPEDASTFDAWLLLGRLRMANPAWSTRAVEALQVASRLKADSAEPWALMGELYSRKGFKSNAQACFKRALDLDPSVPIAEDLDPRIEAAQEATPVPSLRDRLKNFLRR